MNALVTGGTGFVGTNLVLLLRADPAYARIRVFALPKSPTQYIAHLPNVEIVEGDITNAGQVAAAVAGMDVVFHVAGDTSFWSRLYERQRRVNIVGTRTVVEACAAAGVKTLVYTSTVDVLGHNDAVPGGVVDETWPWERFSYSGFGYNYAETKRAAEQIALGANSPSMKVVAIRPGSMIGPFDFSLQYGRLFLDLKHGNVPAIPCGGSSWCNVKDVARAHIRAASHGRAGVAYICAGKNLTYQFVFGVICKQVGAKLPRFVMPRLLLVIYAYIVEFVSNWITHKPPEINPGMARYMSCLAYYDSRSAERDLGYTATPIEECVAEAHRWYLDNKFM